MCIAIASDTLFSIFNVLPQNKRCPLIPFGCRRSMLSKRLGSMRCSQIWTTVPKRNSAERHSLTFQLHSKHTPRWILGWFIRRSALLINEETGSRSNGFQSNNTPQAANGDFAFPKPLRNSRNPKSLILARILYQEKSCSNSSLPVRTPVPLPDHETNVTRFPPSPRLSRRGQRCVGRAESGMGGCHRRH